MTIIEKNGKHPECITLMHIRCQTEIAYISNILKIQYRKYVSARKKYHHNEKNANIPDDLISRS
tara:strand:+ start:364 stop:555 length:192 start_codon:yes stop_codon:yes gene_type:complete